MKIKLQIKMLLVLLSFGSTSTVYASIDGDGVRTPICSGEVKKRNLELVDEAMKELSLRPDFKSAAVFQGRVAEIIAQKNLEKKMAAYGEIIGVDTRDSKELLEFLGSRDHSRYVDEGVRNVGLTADQSDLVVLALKEKILSSVNR